MKKKTKKAKSIFTPEQQKANKTYAKSMKVKKKDCPAVREARQYLSNYKALSKVNGEFCLPIEGVLTVLNNIIKAK